MFLEVGCYVTGKTAAIRHIAVLETCVTQGAYLSASSNSLNTTAVWYREVQGGRSNNPHDADVIIPIRTLVM